MPDDPSDRGDVPRTGDLIAEKYIVERVLGMGGMGLVLAAKHTTLRQPVAIKLLLSEALASEEARRRFVREARAAGGIKSEHVARVRDFGTLESGAPYLVMEYLDGVDLKQRLAEHGPLPISDAVDYVLQASEALCEAHNAGIVHRDLKPANLFLTAHADGSALIKVLDFGISKAACFDSVGHNADLTRTDAVLGSPVYMSPEQVRSPRDVDLRTDIWGIGAVLFELLAGMPPFDADNVAMLGARIVMDPPRSLREARPDVPAALEAVVLKCLEKVPANRYRSIADFAHALGEFAPEGAQLSLQRISRIGSRANAFEQTALAASQEAHPASTTVGISGAKPTASNRYAWVAIGFGVALAAVVLTILGMRSKELTAAPAASGVTLEPTPTVTSPPVAGTSTQPTVSPEPPTSAMPAPSARAPTPSAPTPKSAAPVVKCGPGEVESEKHCCPLGFVWQSNRCERPLAKTF